MGLLGRILGFESNEKIVQNYPTNLIEEGKFFFMVEDVFTIIGRGTVVTGRVSSGELHIGDIVSISGRISTSVQGIEMFRKKTEVVKAGENCGIFLGDISREDIHKGDYLTK